MYLLCSYLHVFLYKDLTQIPTGTKYYQQDLENLFNSDDGDKEEETKNEGSNYTDFMQSQLNLNLIDDPEENKKEAAFYHSDEELSELECFTSIQQLLAKGGDDRRRAEFILRQFQKTDEKSTGPKTTTKKRATPSAKSIGIRRLRK